MIRGLLVAALAAVAGVVALPIPVRAQTVTIDFETLPDGRPTAPGVLRGFEYRAQNVHFPTGLDLIRCGPGATCDRGSRGDHVVRSLLRTEFERYRVEVELLAPRRSVTLHVKLDTLLRRDFTATLTAYDSSGRVVDSRTGSFVNDGTWHPLSVAGAGAVIAKIALTGGEVGEYPVSNFLLVDEVVLEGGRRAAPPGVASGAAPSIVFTEPDAGSVLETDVLAGGFHGVARVRFSARVEASARIRSVHMRLIEPDGVRREAEICGDFLGAGRCASVAPDYDFDLSWPGEYLETGDYTLRVEALDEAGRTGEAELHFSVRHPVVQEADIWVMGIEYNQDIQDTVFTDLDRPVGRAGFVPLYEGHGPSTSLARRIPIVPGKPLAVRVYVGVRDDPPAPAEGVDVTGTLSVASGLVGDTPVQFRPLENPNCQEAIGGRVGNACRREIRVRPSFGRLGLNTNSDYALDLVDRRVRLEGTLNFVIPGELVRDLGARGGLLLGARVQLTRMRDPNPADNDFELQLDNVAPFETTDIRLVRVALPDRPAPTRAVALRAIEDMRRLFPISEFRIEDLGVFSATPRELEVRLIVGDVEIFTVEQCQMLWVDLYNTFGLHPTRTLVAITPNGAALTGCRGLGWKVVDPDSVWADSSGPPEYFGGIGLSEAPAYAGAMLDRGDLGFVAVLAQEFGHAHYDWRHVSNFHGEESGCLDQAMLDAVVEIFLTFSNIDTDCWKSSIHPHGAIGTYPATSVELARPLLPDSDDFSPLGTLFGRIFGDFGGVGMRIESEAGATSAANARGQGWRLTLYDPCPVGGLDPADPLASLGQRVELDRSSPDFMRYRCAPTVGRDPDRNIVPHHFMSYGNNRWAGLRLKPTVTESDFHPAAARPARDEPLAETRTGPSGAAPSMRISGFIGPDGRVFFLPGARTQGDPAGAKDVPAGLVVTDDRGRSLTFPAGVTLSPVHGAPLLFFGADLPADLNPTRIGFVVEGRELGHAEASPNAPTVRVTAPNGGELWVGTDPQSVTWEGSDSDGDALSYTVLLSADKGTTWQPLGTAFGKTSLEVELEPLPPTQTALIRVVASDGLNFAEDTSDAVFAIQMPLAEEPPGAIAAAGAPPAPEEAGRQPDLPGVVASCADRVAEIQERLNRLGYDAGRPDGSIGPRTRAAIVAFQNDMKLRPTGEITNVLCRALDVAGPGLTQQPDRQQPDLVVESAELTLAQSCRPGQPVLELSAIVLNRGAGRTTVPTDLTWRDSRIAVWRGEAEVPPLGPNERQRIRVRLPYFEDDPALMPGVHRFRLSINESGAAREGDRSNNRLPRGASIIIPEEFCPPPEAGAVAPMFTPRPDFVVASAAMELGKLCAPGQPVLHAVLQVRNDGAAPSPALESTVLLRPGDAGVDWTVSASLPALRPGEAIDLVLPLPYRDKDPESMLGAHEFLLTINEERQLEEASYDNNDRSLKVEVPDRFCRDALQAGSEQVLDPTGQIFELPRTEGFLVDWCLVRGQSCGAAAASEWCQANGFKAALDWEQAAAVSEPTLSMGDRAVCQTKECSAFQSITCGN